MDPAASKILLKFSRVAFVWALISLGMTFPFLSIGPCPETNNNSPNLTAGEKGRPSGAEPVFTASFFFIPVGQSISLSLVFKS